jgi:HAE1 family hydrophobic/amphiphilic exporter-1
MIASGAGAAARQSIGTTVFGGMLVATVLSLAFVPVFYAVIERLREGVEARRSEAHTSGSGQPTLAETH